MNEKENKLKLRENEVVHCEAYMLAAQVCELADKLSERWGNGNRYSNRIHYECFLENTCYNIGMGTCGGLSYYEGVEGKTIITAVEWLNRHDIFVYGQEVYVIGGGSDKRIYIAPHVCVIHGDDEGFKDGESFLTTIWDRIKSPFPAWPPEPVKRRLKLDLEVSQEQYDAIKASLGESE